MKSRLKALQISLVLLGILSLRASAETTVVATPTPTTSSATPDQTQLIQALIKKTDELQSQVQSLQTEVKVLKTEQRPKAQPKQSRIATAENAEQSSQPTSQQNTQSSQIMTDESLHAAAGGAPIPEHENNYGPGPAPVAPVQQQAQAASAQSTQPVIPITGGEMKVPSLGTSQKIFPADLLGQTPLVIGGSPVIVSPYLGTPSAFDASDLIVTFTDQNIDLQFLQERQKIEQAYQKAGMHVPDVPIVDLGGALEAQVFTNGPFNGARSSNIDLTKARIDILGLVNKWATAVFSFDYDNTPPAFGPREANSHIYLNKGFITIGSLNTSPWYMSIGQYFMPFGKFYSYLLSDPFTQLLAQIKGRGVEFGYYNVFLNNMNTLNASVFTFLSAAGPGLTSPDTINGAGANIDYTFTKDLWNANAGASFVNALAASNGMQMVTALDGQTVTFPGFGGASGLESLNYQVPAVAVRGGAGYDVYSLNWEYIFATKPFSAPNLFLNSHGARPQAFHVEAMRTFTLWDKPSNFIIGYDFSKDALALLIPAQRYITGFNISIWKDTVESLEYRHDINYASSTIAGGQGYSAPAGPGHVSDTLTAQIGVYF